jgi:hypothetical protein
MSDCDGRCLTGADIGMPEYGGFYAVDPDCSEHGTPMTPEEEEAAACELCYGTNNVLEGECELCREYRLYYESLTVEEQRAEHESMAAYVQESDHA